MSLYLDLLGQVFVLDKVVWVALTAVKNYKHGGFVHVVHAGVIETALASLGSDGRRPAEVVFPNTHLPHQDFGEEHLVDIISVDRGAVVAGEQGGGGEVGAEAVGCSVDPGHARVKVVVADVL